MRLRDSAPTPLIRSGTPLYRQLGSVIRALASDDRELAFTEQQLCERFQVSRTTVRQALQQLEADGLVLRQQGKGTRLIPRKASERQPLWVFGSLEDMIAYARDTVYTLIEHGTERAPDEVAGDLGLQPDAQAYRFLGVRAAEGIPFTLIETWNPFHIGVQTRPHVKDGLSPITALVDDRVGIEVAAMEQTYSAGLATAEVANRIGLRRADPVLVIRRVYFDAAGNHIGVSVNHLNTQRLQYRVRLQRRGSA